MNILAIDTSNQVLGVALMHDEHIIAELVTNVKKNHSVRLMPAIDHIMKETGTEPEQLDKIVVAKGPGSYTGIRIGLSTAKSLAWALQIPVVGVSSLEALAYQSRLANTLICPFFNARRQLVFTGLYQFVDHSMQLVEDEKNILMVDWLDHLTAQKRPIIFLSPDMGLFTEQINNKMRELAIIPEGPFQVTKPSHLALAGSHKPIESTHTLTPSYLRLAEAEANWLKMQEEKQNHG